MASSLKNTDLSHPSNEPPIEFITRRGYAVECSADRFIARLYSKGTLPVILLESWTAKTSPDLAALLGWYP